MATSGRGASGELAVESLLRYRRIVEATNEGIWEVDEKARTTFVNRAMAEMLGLTPADMHGRSLFEFVVPEDHAAVREGRRDREEGLSGRQEIRFRRTDGSILWTQVSAVPLRDESGRYTGALGLCTDITDRVRSEQALEASHQRLNDLIDGVNAILFEADAETWNLTYVSPQAERILGYPVERWFEEGFWIRQVVHPDDRDATEARVREQTERIGDHEIEYRAVRQDGSVLWMRDVVRVVEVDDGLIIRGFMVDVTDRKELEVELRAATDEARRASRAKDQFLSTISHELRTPLAAVLGFAALLKDEVTGPLNRLQKEQLGRIKASAHHLVGIIDEILTFSRSEAGRVELTVDRVDLAEIARDVVGLLESQPGTEDLRLTLKGAAEPLELHTDGGKVRQILTNLVGNAIKYTDAGAVHVVLARTPEHVRFRVSDTGPGIEPDRLDDIFEPFTQVRNDVTRGKGGTGLGLTICRRLATRLGGEITVESQLGEGSTFTFELPLTRPVE